MKYVLALITGIVFGSIANMGMIMLSGVVVPPPNGIDITTIGGLTEAMPLMEPKHFLMPFLAHALGSFVGAWIAARIAPTNKMGFALAIGVFFLIGGIYMSTQIPAPTWFIATDILIAYLPVAYIGGKLAMRKEPS